MLTTQQTGNVHTTGSGEYFSNNFSRTK